MNTRMEGVSVSHFGYFCNLSGEPQVRWPEKDLESSLTGLDTAINLLSSFQRALINIAPGYTSGMLLTETRNLLTASKSNIQDYPPVKSPCTTATRNRQYLPILLLHDEGNLSPQSCRPCRYSGRSQPSQRRSPSRKTGILSGVPCGSILWRNMR